MAQWSLYIWVRNSALVLVILAFVLFFGLPSGQAPAGAVAEVDGQTVSRDVFEFFRDQRVQQQGNPPPGADVQALRDVLDAQTLEAVIQRTILTEEARELGFRVSDAEVREEILADPTFRPDGKFDRERFERYAARSFGSAREFTEELRHDLLLLKFRRLLQSPVRVPEIDVREAVERDLLAVRLRYAEARVADFADGIEISPEQALGLADAEPERVRSVYQQRRAEFRQEEQVHARHMLFRGEAAADRAAEARARVHAGEDFAAVAAEVSEDEGTREEGGDLGFFPRGRMTPELEEVAFELEPAELSPPVETARGTHVIEVLEHRQGIDRSFEEVREELAAELARADRSRGRARSVADELARRLAAGGDFEETARETGLSLAETPAFRFADLRVPGIGRIPGLREAAFELRPEDPVSTQVFASGDSFLLISLLERQEPDPETVEVQMEVARDRMETRARIQLQQRWYAKRRRELELAGEITRYPLYPSL